MLVTTTLQSTAGQKCAHTCYTSDNSTFGDKAFAAAGPGLWNSFPSHPKEPDLQYNKFQ